LKLLESPLEIGHLLLDLSQLGLALFSLQEIVVRPKNWTGA
jgi:hypothetical protein